MRQYCPFFNNLKLALENPAQTDGNDDDYDITKLVNEIMDEKEGSPKLFVINLPEADVARYFCSDVINRVFKIRKSSFTLIPKVVFVLDEAQEFIPLRREGKRGLTTLAERSKDCSDMK
jgi:hypothetical protein